MAELVPRLLILAVFIPLVTYTELKNGKIHNWLTIPGLCLGLFLAFLDGPDAFRHSLAGMLIGGGIFLIPYIISGLRGKRPVVGGGDVKFVAAVGAIMGMSFVLPVIYYSIIFGTVIGLATIAWKYLSLKLKPPKEKDSEEDATGAEGGSLWLVRVPFGTSICLAIMAVFAKMYLQVEL